jgi:hypothetical protein
MAELHVRQIEAAVENATAEFLDLSDVNPEDETHLRTARLTRGLAAYVLSYLAGIEPEDACKAVVDGSQDNGLDAIFYHPADRVLYLVQSKWHNNGNGSLTLGDAEKFLKGVRDLVSARWARFGPKVQAHRQAVDAALTETATRTVLVVAYTGQDPLSPEAADALNDYLRENNEPTELFSLKVMRQADVYAAVASGLTGTPIDLEVVLYEWGQKQEPYEAIYGQVSAADLAGWYRDHSMRLFAPNIRMFLGTTDANAAITETLAESPGDFWYFNNGVTALCRTVKKKLIGGNSRESGTFSAKTSGSSTVRKLSEPSRRRQLTIPRKSKMPAYRFASCRSTIVRQTSTSSSLGTTTRRTESTDETSSHSTPSRSVSERSCC